jgi:hypothetical protein
VGEKGGRQSLGSDFIVPGVEEATAGRSGGGGPDFLGDSLP